MKVIMIDPPNGWRYGFPKPIPEKCLEDENEFRKFLAENGYPDMLLDMAFKHSRCWTVEKDDD